MKVYRFDQYSADWWAVRLGIPTSSMADKILTPTGKLSAQSEGYLNQLLAERAGYADEPMEPTDWMLRGLELEPEARRFFEFETGHQVEQVGFVTNDEGTAGCSPDALVIVDGKPLAGWEGKCPKASTHIGYLRAGELPADYRPQVHFSLAVSGLDEWHFESYYPGLDPLIVKVERDEYTDKVAEAIEAFVKRLTIESERLGLARAA